MLLVGAVLAYPTTLTSRYQAVFVQKLVPLISAALTGQGAAVDTFLERIADTSQA